LLIADSYTGCRGTGVVQAEEARRLPEFNVSVAIPPEVPDV
jgi:hypothetical protein